MLSKTAQLPLHQTAIVAQGPGKLAIKHDVPMPSLAPDMAIVKTFAVAINPVDAKMLDYSPAPGAIHGHDFAGTIIALGSEAPAHLAVGDRVAGMVHGMNAVVPDVGAFAEYVGASADLLLKIPDTMSFEEAAGLGMGVATAAMGLFQKLGLPQNLSANQQSEPLEEQEFVLVAGGSTATGTRAIQMLKLAGFRPIATVAPEKFDLALRFGAEKVFDYHSPTCATDIRSYTGNNLAYTFDCVSMADTTQLCYQAMGRAGGRYVALEPFREALAATRPTIDPSWLLVLTIFGRKLDINGAYAREPQPEDRKFAAGVFAAMQPLLDQGSLYLHPFKAKTGGWSEVIKGVDQIRTQPPSGLKLVYSV